MTIAELHGKISSGGVNQQQHAVDHIEHSFDLAAEVSLPGRVDNVNLDRLAGLRIGDPDGGVFWPGTGYSTRVGVRPNP